MGALFTATWLMFRTHLWTVLRSKRALVCLVLALGPPLISLLPPAKVEAHEVVSILGMMMVLQVIAPLIGLIAGSAVLTEEIENRTITYAFTRPVHRASLFLGRYLATLVLVTGLLAPSALGVVLGASLRRDSAGLPADMALHLVGAAVLAGALYSLITGGLGVFVKRPMVVGLFYLVAMEGFLANVPGSSQKLTLQYYLRSVLGVADNEFLLEAPMFAGRTDFPSPAEAALRLIVLMLIAVVVCTWAIRRRQYVLTA